MDLHKQIRKDFDKLMAEWRAGELEPKSGRCEVIRTVVSLNPEATVQDFLKALPEANASTMRIQFNNSRRIDKEMES